MLRTFPRGLPGLALLVLRVSLALLIIRLKLTSEWLSPFGLEAALVAIAALLLIAGFLTIHVAGFTGVAAVVDSFWRWNGAPVDAVILVSALSFCVTTLGPGSYSLDSLWFGVPRRIFPPER